MKVLITTVPFGDANDLPLRLLKKNNIDYLINPLNKKLTEAELIEIVEDFDVIIAGTEEISKKVMHKAQNLKMISRVGIGLDSVDLVEARKKGILVSYTPDAPAPAVSELSVGLILSLIRSTHLSNIEMHRGNWHRYFGRRIPNCKIGIVGFGRIGQGLVKHLVSFSPEKIFVNEINLDKLSEYSDKVNFVSKEFLYENADVISFHVPLTSKTKNMVRYEHLIKMKSDAVIINTSRGGIVNEDDLYKVMKSGHLSGAAVDVFDKEPYDGKLNKLDNIILTAHMGSMSKDCRSTMEIEATEEAIRFIKGEKLIGLVPDDEYEVQYEGL